MRDFEIAGGSVTGRLHALAGRNNQDAYAWLEEDDLAVAVVADGCGSSPHSEVGAQLGARLVCQALARELQTGPLEGGDSAERALEGARLAVLDQLRTLALSAAGGASGAPAFVSEHLLFTLVGAAITPERTAVFVLGDGLAFVNGRRYHVEAPANTPPYLAYALTGSALTEARPDLLRFRLLAVLPTPDVESILLGTDGVAQLENAIPIGELWREERYVVNPFALRRKLYAVGGALRSPSPARPSGLLPDDTTLVVLRRRAEPAAETPETPCTSTCAASA